MLHVDTGYAKINLALHVRERSPDGYHAIETIFAFAEDGDRLTAKRGGTRLEVTGPFAEGLEGDNLITRAIEAFGGAAWDVRLEKRLPVAAGLGGGSADAGAMLRILAADAGMPIDDPRLMSIAAGLGADVPACVASTMMRGEGRGDRLTAIEAGGLSGMPLLLVNPRVALPTGPVFAGWDGADRGALELGDPLASALGGRNDLEAPAMALRPVITDVLAALAAAPGVVLARMSGSGATCFALFDRVGDRDAAAAAVNPDWWCLATALR